MKKFIDKFLRPFIVLVCADMICAGFWAWVSVQTFERNIPKVQMAIVLAGDFDKKTGELASETHRRLNHAVELYEEKVIEYILCVGGARPRFNVFGSESMRQFLIDAGVPEGRVFAEKKSFDTITNWYMARQIIQGYGWNRVIAVSSPFHLYRFRQIVNSEPNSRVKVFYSPYILKRSSPSITFFDIWKQVHYEWLANVSTLLPKSIYKRLIHHLRGQ